MHCPPHSNRSAFVGTVLVLVSSGKAVRLDAVLLTDVVSYMTWAGLRTAIARPAPSSVGGCSRAGGLHLSDHVQGASGDEGPGAGGRVGIHKQNQ